jgi:phosphatidylserine synthase
MRPKYQLSVWLLCALSLRIVSQIKIKKTLGLSIHAPPNAIMHLKIKLKMVEILFQNSFAILHYLASYSFIVDTKSSDNYDGMQTGKLAG